MLKTNFESADGLGIRKRLHFWQASLFIFGRSYFVRALVGPLLIKQNECISLHPVKVWTLFETRGIMLT